MKASSVFGWLIVALNLGLLILYVWGQWPIRPWMATLLVFSAAFACYFRGRTDELES